MEIQEQPRHLLRQMPGISYAEMENADACCGCGGSFSLKYYELSKRIRRNKINMFLRTQADKLVTGCPACIIHLEDGFFENQIGSPVVHPIQLLAQTYFE
jgi:Fe-S oxidoreductase